MLLSGRHCQYRPTVLMRKEKSDRNVCVLMGFPDAHEPQSAGTLSTTQRLQMDFCRSRRPIQEHKYSGTQKLGVRGIFINRSRVGLDAVT